MVIPLTWDEDGVMECAFATRAFSRGKAVDQLQMHLLGGMGFSAMDLPFLPSQYATVENDSPSELSTHTAQNATDANALIDMESDPTYRIVIVCFDHEGNEPTPVGILPLYEMGSTFPTISIVKPAITNTHVDISP